MSVNEAEAWWPHSGEPGSLQAAYFLTTGLRPSRKTYGTFNATSNTSGFLAWTPEGSSSGHIAPHPTPTCPGLVCPGHLGKHLGTASPGWLPTLQAGGTLQSEQCIPGSSLELKPVYFLGEAMMATKPSQNQQADFSFRLQEVSRKSKHIFHNSSLAIAPKGEPRRRAELTSQRGPEKWEGAHSQGDLQDWARQLGEANLLLMEQDTVDSHLCSYWPGVPIPPS